MNHRTRTLKVKLRPTVTQAEKLTYMGSLYRHIYNWGLARRKETYETTGKSLTYVRQSAEMTAYKQANRWLYDVYADCLQQSLRDLDCSYRNFFEKRSKFPRFKSRHRTPPKLRFAKDVILERTRIKIPKLGWVRVHNTHDYETVKSVTIKQTASGDWYALCVTKIVAQPFKPIETACGIDLGLNSFAVISDGIVYHDVAPPKFFRVFEKRLAKAQKKLSNCKKGSNRRAKAKLAVARDLAPISRSRS